MFSLPMTLARTIVASISHTLPVGRAASTRLYISTRCYSSTRTVGYTTSPTVKRGRHRGSSPTDDDEAPGWNEEFASTSEAFIKADHYSGSTAPADLQRETIIHLASRLHMGTSPIEDFDAPGWKEGLASPSEAFIKADRYSGSTLPADLQRETLAHLQTGTTEGSTTSTKTTSKVVIEKTTEVRRAERDTHTQAESGENITTDGNKFYGLE